MTEKLSEISKTKREQITADFRTYLSEERGLSREALGNASRLAGRFLAARFPDDDVVFAKVIPGDITRFVQREASLFGPGRTKSMVWALRTFFRYLRHRGYIEVNLAGCVPSVPEYSLSTLPKYLPCGSVERVLQSCDRTISQGRRDYAIMLLLARLGLRGGEVVGLMLDDVDWDLGQISVRGKGGRFAKLPLPADVGEALADYLKRDRQHSSSRRLFLTLTTPATGIASTCIVSSLVKRALARAGVESERKGAHLFRHTLATEMLQRGAKLSEIGELLRHRNTNTTRIYAKVDLAALRKLAQTWPGGAR